MNSRPLMTLRATLEPPVEFGATASGHRIYYGVKSGRIEGERIAGELLPGGGDWLLLGSDQWGRLDIRAQMRTHDGAAIYLAYTGWLEVNATVQAAFAEGAETSVSDQYYRVAATFETGDDRYAWLTRLIAVGQGRVVPGGVELAFFEVL